MRTPQFAKEAERWSYGIASDMWSLRPEYFKAIYTVVPPPDEQDAIVRYLDNATRRLEQVMAAKRRVVLLLEEQKQAVIHRAVTRGLDESVPMRDSGIPWLGEVPAGWRVVPLKRVSRVTPGFAFPSRDFITSGGDYRLLRGVNVSVGRIRWTDAVGWNRSLHDGLDRFVLREGTIVLGMDRPVISGGVRVAKMAAEDLPALLLQRVAMIESKAYARPDYLLNLLGGKTFVDYILPQFSGISVPHISGDQIGNFSIPLPPTDEQDKIIDYIERETSDLRKLIKRIENEIALLGEYCTALVAEVVTGQRDVRAAASVLLPLEAPEGDELVEPLSEAAE
jgi:type I restriction enzyme S subunit